MRGYRVAEGDARARQIAAEFSERMIGVPSVDASDPLMRSFSDALVEDWTKLCGGPPDVPRMPTAPRVLTSAAINFSEVDCHRPRRRTQTDWKAVADHFSKRGFTVAKRTASADSIEFQESVAVFELTDPNGKVLSEGKGLSESAAVESLYGEAVERTVAQTVPANTIFQASATSLRSIGYVLPLLGPGLNDLFSDDLICDWVSARTFFGDRAAIPAELAYYPYQSSTSVSAFAQQQTTGLAAGTSTEEAALAGLLECIEGDAYWTSLRAHLISGRFANLGEIDNHNVRRIVGVLNKSGVRVHAGLIDFDWPLAIVHVVLENARESLPALSHGLGAGLCFDEAIERALIEAIQVFTGLEKVVAQYWPDISCTRVRTRVEPAISWSGPSFAPRIVEMFEEAPPIDLQPNRRSAYIKSFSQLPNWLEQNGFRALFAELGTLCELRVVRVHLDGTVSAFTERNGPSATLMRKLHKLGVPYAYLDPILS